MGSFRSRVKLTFEISNLFNLTSALNCYIYVDISKERKNSRWKFKIQNNILKFTRHVSTYLCRYNLKVNVLEEWEYNGLNFV